MKNMKKRLDFLFWPAVGTALIYTAVALAIGILIFGCAANGPFRRGFEEHPEKAGWCRLTLVNEDPVAYELRSARFYETGRDGLLPHTSGTLIIKQGERYTLSRRKSVEGVSWMDNYEFFIPRGTTEHTITFGGLQVGVLVNQCNEPIKVFSPFQKGSVIIPSGGDCIVKVMPGNPEFVVYFGKNWEQSTKVVFKVNTIHQDASFDGNWVDWVGYIDPRVRDHAVSGWRW